MVKWILGINPCISGMNYHDPSAAIFKDNQLLCAIEEERLNRIKGSRGIFPINSIKKCLEVANISLKDLDVLAVGYLPELRGKRISLEFARTIINSGADAILEKIKNGQEYSIKNIEDTSLKLITDLGEILQRDRVLASNSHMGAKILSELGENIKIEFFEHHLTHAASAFYPSGFKEALIVVIDGVGEMESISVWKGSASGISKIEEIDLPYSLGYLYSAFTAFLGFEAWCEEGKTMALAPYGTKDKKIIKKIFGFPVKEMILKSFGSSLDLDIQKSKNFIANYLNIPSRSKSEELTKVHKNIAYAIQYFLEQKVGEIIKNAVHKYKINNICCAGGVFLNCKMNMYLRENHICENIYFQPVAKDCGVAIGAALLAGKINKFSLENLSLGPTYSSEEIKSTLKSTKVKYKISKNLEKDVAKLLSQGKIIFWFKGGVEFGPRALGSRSILADPRFYKTSDFLNKEIKHRELWRPFACSIMEDKAKEVLKNLKGKPLFMIEAYGLNSSWKDKIKAVIHKGDNTTRPQLVFKSLQPSYYNLLNEFYILTGIPLLLNTSLNDKGEPLINTPSETIKYFFSSEADALVLEDYLITKNGS